MVDVEQKLYDTVSNVILASFSTANISGEYVPAPASFPHVTIEQTNNRTLRNMKVPNATEHFATVSFEINVYSNKRSGRKAEAKAVMSVADSKMTELGFYRTMMSPVPNVLSSTVYRLTARYEAVVDMTQSNNEKIFTIYQGG